MYLKAKDIIYVVIQFFLFVIYTLDIDFVTFSWLKSMAIFGMILGLLGITVLVISLFLLNKNASPFPTPKPDSKLIKNGIYKYIRHPIYSGLLAILFGYGIYSNSTFKIAIGVLFYILFLFKSKYEEQRLLVFFKDYKSYIKITGRFIPNFRRF